MRRLVTLAAVAAVAACAADPGPGPASQGPVPQEVWDRCVYVGALRGNDGYGGVGAQAACLRYWYATRRLPPV